MVGSRAKLIDDFNAVRKSIYGQLGEIQHANQLKSGWAESFFQQDSSDEMTLGELDRKIATSEAQLIALKKQREEMAAHEEEIARAKADAERRERRVQLDGIQKAKAELAAKEAELMAQLSAMEPEKKVPPP